MRIVIDTGRLTERQKAALDKSLAHLRPYVVPEPEKTSGWEIAWDRVKDDKPGMEYDMAALYCVRLGCRRCPGNELPSVAKDGRNCLWALAGFLTDRHEVRE